MKSASETLRDKIYASISKRAAESLKTNSRCSGPSASRTLETRPGSHHPGSSDGSRRRARSPSNPMATASSRDFPTPRSTRRQSDIPIRKPCRGLCQTHRLRPTARRGCLPGAGGRFCTEAELAAHAQEGYRRGVDAARSADQQMVGLRADVESLGDGIFKKVSELEPQILAQLRDALPGLALDLAKRLLAGRRAAPRDRLRLCEEALAELFPERDNLERTISPRDAAFLEELKPAWLGRYPGLKLRTDPALAPGDCQASGSRFGLTDARQQTKLTALAHSLHAT